MVTQGNTQDAALNAHQAVLGNQASASSRRSSGFLCLEQSRSGAAFRGRFRRRITFDKGGELVHRVGVLVRKLAHRQGRVAGIAHSSLDVAHAVADLHADALDLPDGRRARLGRVANLARARLDLARGPRRGDWPPPPRPRPPSDSRSMSVPRSFMLDRASAVRSPMVRKAASVFVPASLTPEIRFAISPTVEPIATAFSFVDSASLRISSATTAKPRPASPA